MKVDPNILRSLQNTERLVIWDWKRGGELAHDHLEMKTERPVLVAYSPDGRSLAVREDLRELSWSEYESNRQLELRMCGGYRANTPITLGPGAFLSGGETYAAGGFSDGKVYLWNGAASDVPAVLDTGTACCLCVAASPDGKLLAAAAGKCVQIWDAQESYA